MKKLLLAAVLAVGLAGCVTNGQPPMPQAPVEHVHSAPAPYVKRIKTERIIVHPETPVAPVAKPKHHFIRHPVKEVHQWFHKKVIQIILRHKAKELEKALPIPQMPEVSKVAPEVSKVIVPSPYQQSSEPETGTFKSRYQETFDHPVKHGGHKLLITGGAFLFAVFGFLFWDHKRRHPVK